MSQVRILAVILYLVVAFLPSRPAAVAQTSADTLRAWLDGYEKALASRDLARLADFFDPEVTIFEGGGTNIGWADYRDHHLRPELAEMGSFKLRHADVRLRELGPGWALVTSSYELKARMKGKDIAAGGLETLVLKRGSDDRWRIVHSHMSSRRRPGA
jgi:ketosteroid isomerase-like protein